MATPIPLIHRPARADELDGSVVFPELVRGFEALGFRVVGGMVTEGGDAAAVERMAATYPAEDAARFRSHAHLPDTTLAAPDRSAFIGISWFWDTPAVVAQSLLADGTLVETCRRWTVSQPEPRGTRRALAPDDQQTLRAARRHPIRLVDTDDPATLWDEHRRHVAGRPTVSHDSVELRCAIQADQYDAARQSVRRMDRVVRGLQLLVVVLLAVGLLVAVTGFGGRPGGFGGLVLVLLGGILGTNLAHLQPRLRRASWLRAEFRPVRAAGAGQR